jgi:DNA repair photolyase
MYEFVTHTWNPVKGKCWHDCAYCYMKRWGEQKPLRLDEAELRTDLGEGNFIFVGSSCDLFAQDVPDEWIRRVADKTLEGSRGNKYLWQTKNPLRFTELCDSGLSFPPASLFCATAETNRHYPEIMRDAPPPLERIEYLRMFLCDCVITIEPILDFDMDEFAREIRNTDPVRVNIGADSGGNHLPEPPAEKVRELIAELERFTEVVCKKNLGRLMK